MRQKVTLEPSSATSSQPKQVPITPNSGIMGKEIPEKQKYQKIGKGSSLVDLINEEDFKQSPNMKLMGIPSFDKCKKDDRKESFWDKTCEESRKSLHSCSKVNENSSIAGPLRYALHLRFICPFPKKATRTSLQKPRPNSFPEKTGLHMEGDRRFYLYNDLRVVFPQRHSDADEGKVCAIAYTMMLLHQPVFICTIVKQSQSNCIIDYAHKRGKRLIYLFSFNYPNCCFLCCLSSLLN